MDNEIAECGKYLRQPPVWACKELCEPKEFDVDAEGVKCSYCHLGPCFLNEPLDEPETLAEYADAHKGDLC